MTSILDSSAILAVVNRERGAEVVEVELPDVVVSTVNLAEVVTRMTDTGWPEDSIREELKVLNGTIVPFSEEDAIATGLLRPLTRSRGLSLGDRACIALGWRTGYRVLTADQAWAGLNLGIEIGLIR